MAESIKKDKNSLAGRIAGFVTGKPWISMGLALLLVIAMIPGLQKLGADFGYRIWFQEDDPMLKEYDSFERRFGNDENVAILVHSPSGVFDKESVETIQELTAQLWLVPEIIRVDSLTNYNWTHAEGDDIIVEPLLPDDEELTPSMLKAREKVALSHEVIPGYLVSKDGKTALLYAAIKPSFEGSPNYELIIHGKHTAGVNVEGIRDKINNLKNKSDHKYHITGSGAISDAFREASVHDMSTLVPIILAVIVILILFLLRNFSSLLLSFAVIILSMLFTFGFAGLMGIKFNNVIAVLPITLIAISIADAIHILVTFFQFKRGGIAHKDAVYKTMTKNLLPTFLTSISTTIGFFSFLTAEVQPISHMGFLAGVGVIGAWIVTIFIVGGLLTVLPMKVKVTAEAMKKVEKKMTEPKPWAMAFAGFLARFRVPIIATFAILSALSLYIGLQNEVNSDPFKYFPEGFHLRTATDFMKDNVGGASGVEIAINAGKPDGIKEPEFLAKVEKFQQYLNNYPHVTKTISIIDILKQTNRSLHGDDPAYYKLPDSTESAAQQLFLYTMSLPQGMDLNDRMTIDNDAMRLTVRWTLSKSKEATETFAIFKQEADKIGLDISVTGKTKLYQSMNGYVVSSFISSLTFAILFIGALMIITFRSFKMGLMAMIPNTIPLLFGGALMMLLGKPLDIGTVIVTSICLGIAVDDSIHFMTNFNNWIKAGYSRQKAVAMVFSYTGPALLVTTLILVAGFGTFMFAYFVPNINLGILTALILTTALITDLILLPAMVMTREGQEEESFTIKGNIIPINEREKVPVRVR